ncbi:MAG TPA: hydrogenase formation protein HypD [Alphaproteobacteria bacterium]|nr:hydrogenase formation protein HypD [Alphaproteobacteria bacterium]
MRYVEEFRQPAAVARLAERIRATATRPWSIMEVCGGQTHAIMRFGLDELLPEGVSLLHGPGCPVCVTPAAAIDKALEIAATPGVIFCTFGDMLRVPAEAGDLAEAKARGADVRVVYSPLDAVKIAEQEPDREVVFFAVGFETTAPANGLAVRLAQGQGLKNFSLLVTQVLVPPALEALLAAPDHRIDAFLAAGHVCTVMGTAAYEPIAAVHRVPIVATGFEPVDILRSVMAAVRQLEAGEARVENVYERAVAPEGNVAARSAVEAVFEPVDREWRGIGRIPASGLALRSEYRAFDAEARFGEVKGECAAENHCIAGLVLQGRATPDQCPAFGAECTPEHPLGVTMVSSEGACAAYYLYRALRETA